MEVRALPETPMEVRPVPPSFAGIGVVRAVKDVISEFAPAEATPRADLAEEVVVAPVPPEVIGNTATPLPDGGETLGPVNAEAATTKAIPEIKNTFRYMSLLLNLLSILFDGVSLNRTILYKFMGGYCKS